jgi:4-amino-4-deoxy-L-arabinose transferase-like glycosyltransferase
LEATPSLPNRRPARLGALALIAVVAVLAPLLIARHYGALGIPRGDDWSYLLTLFRLSDTGQLNGNNWVSMTLLGQLVIALPVVGIFGHDIAALQILTAVVGFCGLVATVVLGRRLIGVWPAVLVALTVGAGPLWGPLAASYMTDVPAFAFSMIALACAAVGLTRKPIAMWWIAASLVAALVAFSIRQYAFVLLVAIPLTTGWALVSAEKRRRLRPLAIMAVAAVACAFALYAFWQAIPDLKVYVPTFPTSHTVSVTVIKGAGYARLFGLLLAPVVALAGPVRIARRAWSAAPATTAAVSAGLLLVLAAVSAHVPKQQFVGNYIEENGALTRDVMFGRRPDLFPSILYALLVVIATISAVLIVIAVIPPARRLTDRLRTRTFELREPVIALLALVAAGYTAAYAFAMATGVSVYDRYALPVLPLVGILVLHTARNTSEEPVREPSHRRARIVAAGVALAGIALLGLVYTMDSASFDGTRWRVSEAVTRQGYGANQIDGGFEWLNYYRGHMKPRTITSTGAAVETSSFCVNVYVNPPHIEGKTIFVGEYTLPTRHAAKIIAIRNNKPCKLAHPVAALGR